MPLLLLMSSINHCGLIQLMVYTVWPVDSSALKAWEIFHKLEKPQNISGIVFSVLFFRRKEAVGAQWTHVK